MFLVGLDKKMVGERIFKMWIYPESTVICDKAGRSGWMMIFDYVKISTHMLFFV